MRITTVLIIPAVCLMAACATPDFDYEEYYSQEGCDPYPKSPCTPLGDKETITIDLANKTVTPECVQVSKPNRRIHFTIVPSDTVERNTVFLFPKDESDKSWLRGNNARYKKEIRLRSPRKHTGGTDPTLSEEDEPLSASHGPRVREYKYFVRTPEWCIDPRVHFEN